jgi:uncharacterized membrane-anchored protein
MPEAQGNNEVLFTSLNTIFTLPLLIEQLVHHLLIPSIPYFVWKYGFVFVVAHGYYPFTPTSVFTIIVSVSFPLTLLSAHMAHDEIKQLWIVPAFFFVLHRCMIALKYATLSFKEYR